MIVPRTVSAEDVRRGAMIAFAVRTMKPAKRLKLIVDNALAAEMAATGYRPLAFEQASELESIADDAVELIRTRLQALMDERDQGQR